MAEQLDSYKCSVQGRHLVEAGAGTGKTYNIQVLFLRMVLYGIPVEQILVVTFTELATAELKNRLRNILLDMKEKCDKLKRGDQLSEEDLASQVGPFFDENGANVYIEPENVDDYLKILNTAIQNFDSAPVSTIHGFCSRMLKENTFESGLQYGLEVKKDVQPVIRELLGEFWREKCYKDTDGILSRLVISAECTPDALYSVLMNLFDDTESAIQWGSVNVDAKNIELEKYFERLEELEPKLLQEAEKAFEELRGSIDWDELAKIEDAKKLKHGFARQMKYKLDNKLPVVPEELDDVIALGKGDDEKNKESDGNKKEPDSFIDELLRKSEDLKNKIKNFRNVILRQAYDFVKENLNKTKAKDGFMTFGDMLDVLKKRLESEGEDGALCAAIRSKYTCAFVDEYQDTDQVQYFIFNRIFDNEFCKKENHCFFMIGDPKQAIYKFRGGDIFAYLAAASSVDKSCKHTLNVNYRASTAYITAMNNFFTANENFFQAARDEDFKNLDNVTFNEIGSPDPNPKEFIAKEWDLESLPEGMSPLLTWGKKEQNNDKMYDHAAEEILQLVNNPLYELKISGDEKRLVGFNDVAVLINSNEVCKEFAAKLAEKKIPYVINTESNILQRSEARLLSLFMKCVLDPRSQENMLRLFISPMFGFTVKQLIDARNGDFLGNAQMFFQDLNKLWEKRSFVFMLNTFFNTERKKIFGETDESKLSEDEGHKKLMAVIAAEVGKGKQSIAVYKQLGDALNTVALDRRLGPSALLQFVKTKLKEIEDSEVFFNKKKPAKSDEYEALFTMRLPNEEPAVKIMTIHKSKGLEFPFVFILSMGDAQKKGTVYHSLEDGKPVRKVNVFSDESEKCEIENKNEHRRLMYVAITRARYLCRFFGKFPSDIKQESIFAADKLFKADENKEPEVSEVGGETENKPKNVKITPLKFDRDCKLQPGWTVTSFSKLLANAEADLETLPYDNEDVADVDAEDFEPEETAPAGGKNHERAPIFRFSPGINTGLCWHSIFENIDFSKTETGEIEAYLEEIPQFQALLTERTSTEKAREKLDAFVDMVRGTLLNDLENGIKLAELQQDRISEMSFSYRLKKNCSMEEIVGKIREYRIPVPDDCSKRYFKDVMTGKIDLIFRKDGKIYIADWKTNCLRYNLDNFYSAGLRQEMNEKFYHFQYLIYTVAVIKAMETMEPGFVLNRETYEARFGGVFYIFLRGMTYEDRAAAEAKRGIFYIMPDFELVNFLAEKLEKK